MIIGRLVGMSRYRNVLAVFKRIPPTPEPTLMGGYGLDYGNWYGGVEDA